MQGSSGGFSDLNERESKSNNSNNVSEDRNDDSEEIKRESYNNSELTTNPTENENDEDNFLNQWLYNTNFSFTQLLNKVDDEDEIERKRLKIIDKIKSICDIFAHYSYEDRNYYLEEMHLILLILKQEDIINYVVPSFSIFVDEKEELKFKFLHKCLLVIDKICKIDFETAVDHIVINVLPHLESILRNTKDELQETCINTLSLIFEKLGKSEASSPFNNMITSLVTDLKTENWEIWVLKLLTKFSYKYMEKSNVDEFWVSSLDLFGFSTNSNTMFLKLQKYQFIQYY